MVGNLFETRKGEFNRQNSEITPSFRAEQSGDPESRLLQSRTFWISACAGMTLFEILDTGLRRYDVR